MYTHTHTHDSSLRRAANSIRAASRPPRRDKRDTRRPRERRNFLIQFAKLPVADSHDPEVSLLLPRSYRRARVRAHRRPVPRPSTITIPRPAATATATATTARPSVTFRDAVRGRAGEFSLCVSNKLLPSTRAVPSSHLVFRRVNGTVPSRVRWKEKKRKKERIAQQFSLFLPRCAIQSDRESGIKGGRRREG